MSEEIYDVIVIGGGPAGLTAGIYTARHNLKTLILEGSKLGGRASEAHWIENYPGFPKGVSGSKLMKRFISQAKRFNVEFKIEPVTGLSLTDEMKVVITRRGIYQARSVIISTGIQRKTLRVPGEMKFKGRGVSYCPICDGPFFTGKNIVVIGSNKEAIEDALHLSEIANKVYFISNNEISRNGLLKKLGNTKIDIIEGEVESIEGDEVVKTIRLKDGTKINVDGVFIILDHVPMTDILTEAGVKTDERGCIIIDRGNQTNIKGVFAAGDCICGGMQIITAAGDGGKAGLSALRYMKSLKQSIEAR
ncbi:MAG: NAD(P)/FAD-dependent oxidoreductase [Candidatus Bathyarchaeia archaeon]